MWAGIHLSRRQITNQGFVVIVYEENGRIKDDFKIFQLEQLEWV